MGPPLRSVLIAFATRRHPCSFTEGLPFQPRVPPNSDVAVCRLRLHGCNQGQAISSTS